MKNGPYELVVPPEEYPGKRYRKRYSYEHHVVWWENTGEIISAEEIIHHVNYDKRDNRFSNLEKMLRSEHDKLHANGVVAEKITLNCDYCNSTIERLARNIRSKKKEGQKYFFCSLSCSTKHQRISKDRGNPW